jgi:hypothetical protein
MSARNSAALLCSATYSSGWDGFKSGLPSCDVKELHMSLRKLLPDQFGAQRGHLWQFREYELTVPLSGGWSLSLYFRKDKLRVTLTPPITDDEGAQNAA